MIKFKKIASEGIIAVVILGGIIWVCSRFIHPGNVEYTDNAQVRQQIVPVNSRVQGFIRKIYFTEYQKVHKGDKLVDIEDTEFRLRLAQAEADYRSALAGKSVIGTNISTTQSNLAASEAGIEEAGALLERARNDYERYKKLLDQDAVSPQQFEAVKASYQSLNAKYKMMLSQKKSTSLVKVEQTQRLSQHEANIAVAKAAVELARLNLSYTVITAPCDGVVGRKALQEGQLIQIGQSMVSVVGSEDKWVLANYKETQTTHISEGMPVEITVDAVDSKVKGVVSAISNATGAQYSMIPQDNSAGNFIKVEQLIPVKINFTGENAAGVLNKLRAGMNAECKVKY
jgi:membrane fusion protein, multidrug efflux system